VKYVCLFLSIAFNVASYLLYKNISDQPRGILWSVVFGAGLLLGGINVFFFTKALRDIPLSIAYPVFSGGCIFLMALLSHVIFAERMGAIHVVGAAVIVVGIALMSS
jgi:multidrug transporter EmrE-like cation transporter